MTLREAAEKMFGLLARVRLGQDGAGEPVHISPMDMDEYREAIEEAKQREMKGEDEGWRPNLILR